MKLLTAIISNEDAEAVLKALIEADYRATRIASTGGFLRKGNTTLLCGMAEDRVQHAFEHIRDACAEPEEHGPRRATVFVLDTSHYEQL